MVTGMAANSRSGLASGNPEASFLSSAYLNVQRGSYPGTNFERSGSFQDSLNNRVLSSGAGASKSLSAMPAIEIPSPSNYLMTVPLSLIEQKSCAGELGRVFGISLEESIQCKALTATTTEELKRFKASVLEATSKARERARALLDSSAKLERYVKLISKKRQRNDLQSSEKPGGANLLRTGSQIHQSSSNILAQRHDAHVKSTAPNKRVRSSMGEMRQGEGRSALLSRQNLPTDKDKNITVDKDKNMFRACNSVALPAEEKIRPFPSGGEMCENKMRKKRSVGTVANRSIDGDREPKMTMQRYNNETRPRHSSGSAFSAGNKNNTVSQLDDSSCCTTPRNDLEVLGPSTDKDWNPSRGGNNNREDAQIGSPRPLMKGKSFRGPRSSSSGGMNTSPSFRRTSDLSDTWDQPPTISGMNNRKGVLSDSPPVSQWGGHRLPKSNRTKRNSVISHVSNPDEAAGEVSSPADGPAQSKNMSSARQIKLKIEGVTSPVSDGQGTAVNRPLEKGINNTREMEEGVMNGVRKVASLMLPSKKNKNPFKEAVGGEVRRHGRGGRGPTHVRTRISSPKEQMDITELTKSPRSGKPISEISRGVRPPLRKSTDRKGSTCSGQGESDHDHDELMAAANAARSASYQSCSSPFWKKMDQLFCSVSEENMAYLRKQMNFVEELDLDLCSVVDVGQNLPGDVYLKILPSKPKPVVGKNPVQLDPMGVLDEEKWFKGIFPLSQMLLAAFIMEKETDIYDDDPWHEVAFVGPADDYSTSTLVSRETEMGFEPDVDFLTRKGSFRGQDHIERASPMRTDAFGSPHDFQYKHMCLDDRILLELRNVGMFLDPEPGLAEEEDDELDGDLQELKKQLYDQIRTRKRLLRPLIKAVEASREADERRLEQTAMDKLVELAYKKYQRGRGGHGSSHKSGVTRVSRQVAQAFAERVLARCRSFEATGICCFAEPSFKTILSLHSSDPDPPSSDTQAQKAHQEPRLHGSGHVKPEGDLPGEAMTGTAVSTAAAALSNAFSGRSERDLDPQCLGSRTSLPKPNRKAKPSNNNSNSNNDKSNNNSNNDNIKSKHKATSPLGTLSAAEPCEQLKSGSGGSGVEETIDFSSLPLDSVDGLDVGVGLGEQAQDLGSWLSLDDDALQDDDFSMGLEIPMDDLSELNMNMNF